MLSKEECEVVVAKLYHNGYVDLTDCDIIAKLIKEHFELVDKHTSKVSFLTKRIKQLEYLLERKESEFLKIEVLDKETNKKHIVGTDVHDCLLVEKGVVIYYNLQNGGSTDDYYEFVEKELYDEFE